MSWFGLLGQTGRKGEFGYFPTNEFFDALQAWEIHMVDERKGSAFALSPGSTPDAVHIIFSIAGGFKINHKVNAVNVNAAAQYVSGHQDVNF